MPTLRSVLTLALGLASAAAIHAFEVRARAQDGDLAARLERAAEQFVAQARIPALAVAIDVGGEPLLERGWGERAGRPVGVHTAFPAGSLAAQCIASGVLELAERGELDLAARVGEYVAEFADDPRPITVEHLLAHASGLPPLDGCPAAGADSAASQAAMLAWLREAPSIADAGHCLAYSDSDTLLLGLILERIGGTPVRSWIEQRVIEELELQETRFDDAADAREPYGGGQEIVGRFESDGDAPALFDAHALLCSARDLASLQRAWIDGKLVSDQSWLSMTAGGHFADGSPTHFGLGFGLTPLDGQACVSFGGRARGARLLVAWYPVLDVTIALLAEGDDAALPLLERRLARMVHGLPQPELQDLALTPQERAAYLGDYYMGCTRHTIVEGPDGRLRALTSEPGERVLLAQGGHVFVAGDDVEVRYRFELDEGRATAFVLDERGSQSRAVRID